MSQDPRTVTRAPSLTELRLLFPPSSALRRDLIRHAETLNAYVPEPPAYVWWHLARFTRTLAVLRPYVSGPVRWLDVSSEPWFWLLAQAEFPEAEIMPTGFGGGDDAVSFTRRPDGYRREYTPVRLAMGADLADFALGAFDVVTAFELLEHLQFHPAPFFAAVNAALVGGGRLVLSTPNGAAWTSIHRLVGGGNPQQTYRFGGPWTHRVEYTPWEVQQLAASSGFERLAHQTFDCYPSDRLGWRSALLRWSLVGWHALTVQPVPVRNLAIRAGSTQWFVGRKTAPCDVSAVCRI